MKQNTILVCIIFLLSQSVLLFQLITAGQQINPRKTIQAEPVTVKEEIQYLTNKNVTEIIQTAFPTFYSHLKRAGYIPALESADNVTVFAPTEAAFKYLREEAIGEDAYNNIFYNNSERGMERLTNILKLHILPERLLANEIIQRETLKPYAGGPLNVSTVDSEIRINNSATLVDTDIIGTNGVVHAINVVLF